MRSSFDISLFADGAYPCYAVVDQYKRIKKIFIELTNSCGWGSSLFEQDKTRIDRLKSETISKKKVPFDYQMDMPIPARIAIDFNRNHKLTYVPWSHYNFIFNDKKFLKNKKNKKIKLCNLKISSNALVIEDSPSISRSDLSVMKVRVSPDGVGYTFPVKERTIIPLENKTYPIYLYYSEKSEKVIIKDLSRQYEEFYVKSILEDKSKNVINDQNVNNTKVRFQKITDLPPKDLRKLVDIGKKELGEGIIIVFAIKDGKIGLAVGVTNKLTKKYDAVKFAKTGSEIVGGKGGGGRADFAQAGGSEISKIEEAFEKTFQFTQSI